MGEYCVSLEEYIGSEELDPEMFGNITDPEEETGVHSGSTWRRDGNMYLLNVSTRGIFRLLGLQIELQIEQPEVFEPLRFTGTAFIDGIPVPYRMIEVMVNKEVAA